MARISELLERTLSSRSQPRPVFVASDSSLSNAEPSDEMLLRLTADVKAERDELGCEMMHACSRSREAVRCTCDNTERREAWIAPERPSLLEVDKRAAVRAVEESDTPAKGLRAEPTTTKAEPRAGR
jgi:hypothetical protein